MKFVVKKWGNSFGIHIPKELPGVGKVHENMKLDFDPKPVKDMRRWKPVLFKGLDPGLSQNVDEILEEAFEEKWGKGPVRRSR